MPGHCVLLTSRGIGYKVFTTKDAFAPLPGSEERSFGHTWPCAKIRRIWESRISSSTCSSRARRRGSAEDIAQAIDSIGGQLDAFTAKEYASYYIKVLDEHLPLAIDILVRHRPQPGVQRRRHRAREEGRRRRDQDGRGHAGRPRPRALHAGVLGEPSARPADSRHHAKPSSRSTPICCATISATPTPRANLIVSAVGNLEHERVRELVEREVRLARRSRASRSVDEAPRVVPKMLIRNKELEQSHLCLGVSSYPQNHDDRYVELRAEHAARRLDELAAVPERPREARAGATRCSAA